MATIWVDADGSPKAVLHAVETLATDFGWQFRFVATYAHQVIHPNRIVIDTGDQTTDLYIVNHLQRGDIVVTQDIGLAAICMSRHAHVIHISGHVYRMDEMDFILELRASSAKARRMGLRTKGPKKRTSQDDQSFYEALQNLLQHV